MNTAADYLGPLPNGWTGGQARTKWWRGKHVHLYHLEKPCAQCKGTMQIDVTRDALEGRAKNAGLHLTRCAGCRAAAKALGLTSRPRVEGQTIEKPEPVDPTTETIIATMRQELDGLYAQNRELRERLAQYELGPALERVAARMPWEN